VYSARNRFGLVLQHGQRLLVRLQTRQALFPLDRAVVLEARPPDERRQAQPLYDQRGKDDDKRDE
jgi:hypothetical protein